MLKISNIRLKGNPRFCFKTVLPFRAATAARQILTNIIYINMFYFADCCVP